MKSPCKDCAKRHPGCHGECEIYQAYNKQQKEKNIREYRERRRDADYKEVRAKHKE